MSRIIFKSDENSVAVVVPSPKYSGTIEELAESVVPDSTSYEIVEDSDVPSDRTFRNAWTLEGSTLSVNMGKAKDIAHSARRTDRDILMAPLDIKATIPAEQSQAEVEREAIRDANAELQIKIDACETPEALSKLIVGLQTKNPKP
jgi:Flp pilus assembly secretin CpaC